jgi:CubicO group peptidase (beta-lactamase class C family)
VAGIAVSHARKRCSARGLISGLAALGAATFGRGLRRTRGVAQIGAAFAAKSVCSGVFVSGRAPEAVIEQDLRAYGSAALDLVRVEVDREARTVTGRLLGLGHRQAVFREGFGCTLAIGTTTEALRAATPELASSSAVEAPLSVAETTPALERALDEAFAETDPALPKRTRAVVIVHRGCIVAERYAPGFTPEMRLLGWSLTKSVTSALVGILVREGRLAVEQTLDAPEWRSDARAAITLADCLHMSTGLAFDERYEDPLSDVNAMLWGSADVGGYAAAKPLIAAPGTCWSYASGTTNLISRALRVVLGADYHAFPRRALFDRIGMSSAIIETDAAGTFFGSSLMFATARDWARFGLLHLEDGIWNGERILPAGWVRYISTPAPAAPQRDYGAHWWLKLDRPAGSPGGPVPRDTFHAAGHGRQFISVIPSHDLVIVRLGHAIVREAWDHEAFIARVIAALAP